MVACISRTLSWVFFAFLAPLSLALAEDVRLSIEFQKESLQEGVAIEGDLSIFHSKNDAVNPKTAIFEGKSLQLQLVKEVEEAGRVKSVYRFKLGSRTKGLYVLSPITVEVGGRDVSSARQAFEVGGSTQSQASVNINGSLLFKLEPIIEGRQIFYPGQKAIFGYRLIYNQNVEMTKDEMPLLEPKGFKKIGGEDVKNFRKGSLAYREIRQQVQAVNPGRYVIGPSVVSGKPYTMTLFQTKEYLGETVEAKADPVILEIKAFPDKGKPASFNGAIGKKLTFKVVLQSFSDVSVGDKFTLSMEIAGDGEVESAPMPEVCCQPGFPGRFRLSDIPPAEIYKNGIKYIVIDLTPLSTAINEIPGLEFSYFDPENESYHTLNSNPIPVKVRPTSEGLEEIKEEAQKEQAKEPSTATEWPELNAKPEKIEIETIFPLTTDDLQSRFLGTFSSLWILLFGGLALILQLDYRYRKEKRKEKEKVDGVAARLWKEIEALPEGDKDLYPKIARALIAKLFETGHVSRTDVSWHELADAGVSGEIKRFLHELEEDRFSGKGQKDPAQVKQDALRLMQSIKPRV
ncbi:BatD family protein [Estrella lausannensis]|uniref:Conserved putative membrane protein n=1 Tax=Estrella lausannensis TaxID=483423 RepID=A0A0H5E6K7_9BACT|nr:BatD family protein [Estrella lausannensis]CRX38925.1 Conserved putative membrane protein [Estrella lausannensis]